MSRPANRHRAGQRGMGLLEVLVTLVVLSLGFLYTAEMQVRGMRGNQAAYQQTQAQMLASDMMDRMRGNLPGVAAGGYDGADTNVVTTLPTCLDNGCSPAELANADLYEWRAQLVDVRKNEGFAPMLPAATDGKPATGTIAAIGTDGNYRVTLAWEESASSMRTFSVDFRP